MFSSNQKRQQIHNFSVVLIVLLNVISNSLVAQKDTNSIYTLNHIEFVGGGTNSNRTPFWNRNLEYGSVPISSPFSLIRLSSENKHKTGNVSWAGRLELVAGISDKSIFQLPVSYLSAEYKNWYIYVGRKKETIGITDTTLSSGSYTWSGNALPIPKIHIGTNGFVPLPIFKNKVFINANIAHGWFGKQQFASNYFLHQKVLYFKFQPRSPFWKVYAGIVHFAQWGGSAPWLIKYNRTDPNGNFPSSFKDFINVFLARKSSPSMFENQLGNHVGSIDFATSINYGRNNWLVYYQHSIESRGILRNLPDGLYGISWQIKQRKNQRLFTKITLEVLSTLNQNTSYDTTSNVYFNDDYFNHPYQYFDGWTYQHRVIGNPFITMRTESQARWFDVRGSYKNDAFQQINSNRLIAIYGGLQTQLTEKVTLKLRLSTWLSYLSFNPLNGLYQEPVRQFSSSIELAKKAAILRKGDITFKIGIDQGTLLSNTYGGIIHIKYPIHHK